jgi:hypothetical protein
VPPNVGAECSSPQYRHEHALADALNRDSYLSQFFSREVSAPVSLGYTQITTTKWSQVVTWALRCTTAPVISLREGVTGDI